MSAGRVGQGEAAQYRTVPRSSREAVAGVQDRVLCLAGGHGDGDQHAGHRW